MRRPKVQRRQHQAGQSTLEYILVLAAVLVALIVGATQVIQPATNRVLEESGNLPFNFSFEC